MLMTTTKQVVVTPARILQTGLGFWSSKVLLTAVKLDLFTLLSHGNKSAKEIAKALKLQQRGLYDFLDTLVAFKFLHREGLKENAIYSNTLETDVFLNRDN